MNNISANYILETIGNRVKGSLVLINKKWGEWTLSKLLWIGFISSYFVGNLRINWSIFRDLLLPFLYFLLTGQYVDMKRSGKERGMESGKLRQPGLRLGTPWSAIALYVGTLPTGYSSAKFLTTRWNSLLLLINKQRWLMLSFYTSSYLKM